MEAARTLWQEGVLKQVQVQVQVQVQKQGSRWEAGGMSWSTQQRSRPLRLRLRLRLLVLLLLLPQTGENQTRPRLLRQITLQTPSRPQTLPPRLTPHLGPQTHLYQMQIPPLPPSPLSPPPPRKHPHKAGSHSLRVGRHSGASSPLLLRLMGGRVWMYQEEEGEEVVWRRWTLAMIPTFLLLLLPLPGR